MTTAATSPARSIPLSVPALLGNEWAYVKECLDTGWVSSVGAFVTRFEQSIARYTGAGHAVAVTSGTAALHIALQVAGVEPGDAVLTSTLSFIAPANAIRYCGAEPIFVDADPQSWQMDARKLEDFLRTQCVGRDGACYHAATGCRVRAILPVHILGLACEMDELQRIADDYHLIMVEDAAEGIGVRYRGRHVGTFGRLGILSFNGNKLLTCGGGGMVLTDDATLARRVRYLTTQAKDDEMEYIHHEVGYNYRLTNVQAAIGLAQLEQLDGLLARKRAIAAAYHAALQQMPGLTPMPVPAQIEAAFWLYTVLLPAGVDVATRQSLLRALRAKGIEARPLWHPLHALPPYRDAPTTPVDWAMRCYERAISLPSSPGLTDEQQGRCLEMLRESLWEHDLLR